MKTNKGEFDGDCNRTACTHKNAKYYNYSTRKYYCQECAQLINDANRADSYRLFGHDLCLLENSNHPQP